MIVKLSLGRLMRKGPHDQDVPVLRRADSHPDAPARRPIRASEEFGQPLPMTASASASAVARDLPADLDTPLAAIDPAAIPESPRDPVQLVAPLASRPQIIDSGERFETFELTPIKRESAPTVAAPSARSTPPIDEPPPSIGALLDRLEQKASREGRPRASIEETLGMLRSLAAQ